MAIRVTDLTLISTNFQMDLFSISMGIVGCTFTKMAVKMATVLSVMTYFTLGGGGGGGIKDWSFLNRFLPSF